MRNKTWFYYRMPMEKYAVIDIRRYSNTYSYIKKRKRKTQTNLWDKQIISYRKTKPIARGICAGKDITPIIIIKYFLYFAIPNVRFLQRFRQKLFQSFAPPRRLYFLFRRIPFAFINRMQSPSWLPAHIIQYYYVMVRTARRILYIYYLEDRVCVLCNTYKKYTIIHIRVIHILEILCVGKDSGHEKIDRRKKSHWKNNNQ